VYNVDFYDPNYDKYSLITDTSTVNINRSDTSVNLRIPFDKTTRVHVHLWYLWFQNKVNKLIIALLSITFLGTGGFLVIRYKLFKMAVC